MISVNDTVSARDYPWLNKSHASIFQTGDVINFSFFQSNVFFPQAFSVQSL